MKICFTETDPKKVLASIKSAMGGRKLAEMVSFELEDQLLKVIIAKMGQSVLTFSESRQDDSIEYSLKDEKIAFAHKPFKHDVTEKILYVIEKAGGVVKR
jgi:GTP-sensing pleiotropic transcriptional regulator CodY